MISIDELEYGEDFFLDGEAILLNWFVMISMEESDLFIGGDGVDFRIEWLICFEGISGGVDITLFDSSNGFNCAFNVSK